ncbi:MAG: P-II family nitrogen regulator [Erysipelotrichaceae bacterium]|nr:P-II family nitrogen regulator [Erysipelotrichaceae bacterium]
MNEYELIMCIVNNGFSDEVMDVAKQLGATGGTIIHARGTTSKEAEKIFNITIEPEKEIVMIIVDKNIKDKILKGLYDNCGNKSKAQGIAFSLPIDDVVKTTN